MFEQVQRPQDDDAANGDVDGKARERRQRETTSRNHRPVARFDAVDERRHLLSISDLSADDIERLLSTAHSFALSQARDNKKLPTLRGRLVLNVFYESLRRKLDDVVASTAGITGDAQ